MALGRGRIPIPGFIRSPPTLAVYDLAHSLLREGVGRGFYFTEDETRKHFLYLSGTFRDSGLKIMTALVNKIYVSGDWPKNFLDVTMIALPKECSDHRTISLISHTGKITAGIPSKRLESKAN